MHEWNNTAALSDIFLTLKKSMRAHTYHDKYIVIFLFSPFIFISHCHDIQIIYRCYIEMTKQLY